MKAAVVYEPNTPPRVEDVSLDDPQEREVLIRNVACGICHSDLAAMQGQMGAPMPVVLGHEGAGIVEEVGPGVTTVQPGDHVIAVTVSCGKCRYCAAGVRTHCVEKMPVRLSGALPGGGKRIHKGDQELHHLWALASLAEYSVVHESSAVKVREDAPLDVLCLMSCGVSTGIGAVLNVARLRAGENIVIYGCGGVGLAAVMGARLAGAGKIIAVDTLAERLEVARELGADHVINATKEDPQERVFVLTGGADYAVECVGNVDVMTQALGSIHNGGTLVVIGVPPLGSEFKVAPYQFLLGKTITGCAQGATNWPIDLPRLVDLYMDGKLPIDKLITKTYDLDQIHAAFEALEKGEGVRSVIRL
jgi:S-(hydroxymethyl)glutathione dehydrogenase/alcohol dehydrogenase